MPVLVDGDASREIGLLSAELCSEIKTPVRFPLFLWLSPDGNPVSWIPVNGGDDSAVVTLFRKSNSMVVEMWRDDPEYVVTNSAADNAMRRERMSLRKNRKRFNPDRPDSILEHALPDEKLRHLYSGDDFMALTADDPAFITINDIRVPYAVFENADDVTTARGDALGERLHETLTRLWTTYHHLHGA